MLRICTLWFHFKCVQFDLGYMWIKNRWHSIKRSHCNPNRTPVFTCWCTYICICNLTIHIHCFVCSVVVDWSCFIRLWQMYLQYLYCVTRAPLLYFVRSWVALSFKVCPSVRQSVRHPYLIFVIFLHGQNFWRIKFTPKNANFPR